jgi:hypothetical protein
MGMRELVIEKIKKNIDCKNERLSWQENFVPEKYPDFDKESDESLVERFDNLFRGPIG